MSGRVEKIRNGGVLGPTALAVGTSRELGAAPKPNTTGAVSAAPEWIFEDARAPRPGGPEEWEEDEQVFRMDHLRVTR